MRKLAVMGGTPVRKTLLRYGSEWMDNKDIESIIRVLKSDF